MEQWEIDLRAKLEAEIPHGAYNISSNGWVMWTGKGGYINYLVEQERLIRPLRGLEPLINEGQDDKLIYTPATMKDYIEFMEELQKKNDGTHDNNKKND